MKPPRLFLPVTPRSLYHFAVQLDGGERWLAFDDDLGLVFKAMPHLLEHLRCHSSTYQEAM